jgi:thymidylate synthase (FAD)
VKTAKMSVELIDYMGTDLSIVNAARVSFDRESDWEYLREIDADGEQVKCLSEKDTKLINYLAKHNHWSPFAHTCLSFRIKAPIFVARQLGKHQVGGAWNEVSRRYVDSEPEFYFPEYWRKRAENVKQGSSDEAVDVEAHGDDDCDGTSYLKKTLHVSYLHVMQKDTVWAALQAYQRMLEAGVCAEQARMVLPQNTMTTWIWTGSLAFFARVCKLRLDSHTQRETQEVAKDIERLTREKFPVSFNAFMEN